MTDVIHITKASGETVVFDPKKLLHSLRRAGASGDQANKIVHAVTRQIQEGMTTKKIYKLAHRMLRKEVRHTAARYSLKQALLGLGPSGYPFEEFIAKLLETEGFKVQTGLIREGRCVQHELDAFAVGNGRLLVGECKFHNRQHLISDVKVPLYIHSRFNDLLKGFLSAPEWKAYSIESWIFTNTRFTDDALQYGRCAGLHLVDWDSPFENGLRDRVDRTGFHPLTCLTTLTIREKDLLLQNKLVLARDLLANPNALSAIQVAPGRVKGILQEAEQLCSPVDVSADG